MGFTFVLTLNYERIIQCLIASFFPFSNTTTRMNVYATDGDNHRW